MKYWYDTEFLDDGHTVALISIAIVSEDGREYYAVNRNMPVKRVQEHTWLAENVWPHLPLVDDGSKVKTRYRDLDLTSTLVRDKLTIANEVREFLLRPNESIELWGYWPAYDHVLLMQLWGPAVLRPKGIPMRTNDIEQEAVRLGLENSLPAQTGTAHNALDDARWAKEAYEYLRTQRRLMR